MFHVLSYPWWRHQMETFSALLAICAGNSPVPQTKATDAELWFFFICVWINGWVNNREAGDLRRYRAHYDVIVKSRIICRTFNFMSCTRQCFVNAYSYSLQWRHNERDGVSNRRRNDCLLNRLRCKSKKTLKLRVTGFLRGNAPIKGQ